MNDNLDTRFLGGWVDEKTGKLHYFHYQKVPFKHLFNMESDEFLQGLFIKAPSMLPSDGITQGVFNTYMGIKIEFLYQDCKTPMQSYIYNFSQDGNKLCLGDFNGNILIHLSRDVFQESVDFVQGNGSSEWIDEF